MFIDQDNKKYKGESYFHFQNQIYTSIVRHVVICYPRSTSLQFGVQYLEIFFEISDLYQYK